MTTRLLVQNSYTIVETTSYKQTIDDVTSFKVPGYWFSPLYKKGFWDGKTRLFSRSKFPTGLLLRVSRALQAVGEDVEVVDLRTKPNLNFQAPELTGIELRDYQLETVLNCIEWERGIVSLPSAAGKTNVAAGIVSAFGQPKTLVLVHRKDLLYQIVENFQKHFKSVGIIGDGKRKEGNITIATWQSVPEGTDPLDVDLLIIDEAHNACSEKYYKVAMSSHAYHRFGLCLHPDTVVLTKIGGKPISKIEVGDYVSVGSKFASVQNVFHRPYNGKLVKVKAWRCPPIFMTPKHLVLVRQFGGTRIQKLRWVEAQNLTKNDWVVLSRYYRERSYAKIGGFPFTKDFFELCGWYAAEGSVYGEKRKRRCRGKGKRAISFLTSVSFSVGYDEEDGAHVKDLSKPFGAVSFVREGKDIQVDVYSPALAKFLSATFGRGAQNKHIPLWVLEAPRELVQSFLKGYFKGDGNVSMNETQWTSVSASLSFGIQQLVAKLGGVAYVTKQVRETPFGKGVSFDGEFYGKDVPDDSSHRTRSLGKRFLYSRVRSIEEVEYSGEVFDLEVGGTQPQFCVPFIVHNSASANLRGDKRDLFLVGLTGEVLYKKTPDELREYLSIPKVKIFPIKVPKIDSTLEYPDVYSAGISNNEYRNEVICILARECTDYLDMPTLILVREIEHGRILSEKLGCPFIYGESSTGDRLEETKKLRTGSSKLLIASVIFNEGIDWPDLQTVIIAGGGESSIQTMQRVGRVMRKKKFEGLVIDFFDDTHAYLRAHSKIRIKDYEQRIGSKVIKMEL